MPPTRSTFPLFPTDDGWPYPDRDTPPGFGSGLAAGADGSARGSYDTASDDDVDLDALELRAGRHAFDSLTVEEYTALSRRFGLAGPPCSMKTLAQDLGCSRADAREVLGRAIDKMRTRLTGA
ncbi:MAG TPA: hypothetical protein VFW74_17535 [Acidimicrobiia bacterium]|nr:hypothetical protein [Acidimicrobiia bacterium]